MREGGEKKEIKPQEIPSPSALQTVAGQSQTTFLSTNDSDVKSALPTLSVP